jgi:hypothetical protein
MVKRLTKTDRVSGMEMIDVLILRRRGGGDDETVAKPLSTSLFFLSWLDHSSIRVSVSMNRKRAHQQTLCKVGLPF